MSFLDNSGDILLDAVLTDTGRYRLAKGNGSFKITKFAFGDDEINYNLYEKNHLSGSAYNDLVILQTPILEAFTNNASTMNSKLISIPKTNLLFLPVMKMNTDLAPQCTETNFTGLHVVCATPTLEAALLEADTGGPTSTDGILRGVTPGNETTEQKGSFIQVDQGLDTTKIGQLFTIDPDLKENQYIVQIDNRLGRIVSGNGNPAAVSFIDDDNIATYYLSSAISAGGNYYVGNLINLDEIKLNAPTNTLYQNTKIQGPLGSYVRFKVAVSVSLNTSDYYFDTLGGGTTATIGGQTVKFIDSIIKITGATTGYSIDMPVRFIR